MLNKLKTAVMCLILSVTVSCTATFRNHGYTPDEEAMANVVVGVDTRVSVEETLGAPTAGGLNTGGSYYYISSRWQHYGTKQPKPIFREIVAVQFNASDVVKNISRYGLEDGDIVVLSRRVTAGGGEDISFISQMLGNIGRFDAENIFGQP
jgi:outer membrane protein assembly factor BamE (lipoprotein component of BamABCDE complex)|tara:strand:+ start:324 stop:776 length:453 start_codon:yes stop_codon:yes gene_type:complete